MKSSIDGGVPYQLSQFEVQEMLNSYLKVLQSRIGSGVVFTSWAVDGCGVFVYARPANA